MASSMGGPFRGSRNWWPIQEFSCRRGRDHPWVKFVVALRTMSLRPLQGRRVFLGESRGSPAKAGSPLAEFCCRFATSFREESTGSPTKAGSPLAEFCCRFATNFREESIGSLALNPGRELLPLRDKLPAFNLLPWLVGKGRR